MRLAQLCAHALLVSCLSAAQAEAEVYTWTDARGRVHMTDDLTQVPPEHRAQAQKSSRSEVAPPARWNAVPEPAREPTGSPASPEQKPRVHVLPVDRAGAEMRVVAELDGQMRAPFIVDTGAMINTIPEWVVREMEIEIDEDTPSTIVRGISGRPMFVRVVTFGSVRVGGAEVEDVEMAVLPTQSRGLLGMPFFNHFKVSTDPARGTLTLEELDLDSVEGVYGGQNERGWRAEFSFIQHMLDRIASSREQIPSEFSGHREQLDRMEEYWQRQLDELEYKASRAGVPRAWRE